MTNILFQDLPGIMENGGAWWGWGANDNYLEGLLKHGLLDPTPKVSDLVSLG